MNKEFEGLNLVELLRLLEDAPEPLPIPLTPQTPGWIVLGAAALIALVVMVRWALRRHRAEAYRRAALRELVQAGDNPEAVASILRRTALAGFPRGDVAALAGTDWLAFLDRTFPGKGFASGPGQVLASAPYRPHEPAPGAARLAQDWVRHHSRNAEFD